ncbi:MAG: phage holin family protein [Planctomycetia bacterium]|nr:phage holin family protein [Planctomycetia bacterium]
MPADSAEESTTQADKASTARTGHDFIRRLVRAMLEIMELEVQIMALRLLAILRDILVQMGLLCAAVVLALTGMVFLEITIFKGLQTFIPTLWVLLIFGLGHLLLAGGLVFLVSRSGNSHGAAKAEKSPSQERLQ